MALVWVDTNRRHFVSTTSSTKPGKPYERMRWGQRAQEPRRIRATVNQPKVVEEYYNTCAAIDQHNRCRQDDLQLDRKIEVKTWDRRVNLGILGFCVADSWKLYRSGKGISIELSQKEFYEQLADALFDHEFGSTSRHRETVDLKMERDSPGSRRATHLTPTKRRRSAKGELTPYRAQCRCRGCVQRKSSQICSTCFGENSVEHFYCHSKSGRFCFEDHVEACH